MNEIDQIDKDALSYEVSDEAVEVAGTKTEIAGAWTWVCTGIGCNYGPHVWKNSPSSLTQRTWGSTVASTYRLLLSGQLGVSGDAARMGPT